MLYALSCLSHSSLVAFDTLSALPVVRLNRAQIAHKSPLCLSPAAPFARLRTHTRVFENKGTQQTCARARPSQSWQHTMVHMHTKYALFESYVCTNRIKPSTSHMSTGNVDNRARNICKHNRIVRESLTECCAQSQRQYTVHARFVHTDCNGSPQAVSQLGMHKYKVRKQRQRNKRATYVRTSKSRLNTSYTNAAQTGKKRHVPT